MKKYRLLIVFMFLFAFVSLASCDFEDLVTSSEGQSEPQETSNDEKDFSAICLRYSDTFSSANFGSDEMFDRMKEYCKSEAEKLTLAESPEEFIYLVEYEEETLGADEEVEGDYTAGDSFDPTKYAAKIDDYKVVIPYSADQNAVNVWLFGDGGAHAGDVRYFERLYEEERNGEVVEVYTIEVYYVLKASGSDNESDAPFETQCTLEETSFVTENSSAEKITTAEIESEPCPHSKVKQVTDVKRTCTRKGKVRIVCRSCKETVDHIRQPALGHEYGEWITVSEVSADTDGVKYRVCQRCRNEEYETIAAGYSVGLEFISYGNGTCYLASIGSCKSLDVVVPEVSPDGDIVIAVGDNAFWDEEAYWVEEKICEIESITLPDSVEVIGNDAFNTCENLVRVKFPKNLKIIEAGAFEWCESLSSVVLPDGVTQIGYKAFNGCRSLSSVKLSKALQFIGEQAFNECINLSSIDLPQSVTYIGRAAFYACDNITRVHIPASVEWIGDCAVSGKAQKITVDPSNRYYRVENNCLISSEGRVIIGFGNFQIPSDATSIGESAFEYNSSVSDIVIPSSVTEIGDSAFAFSAVTNVTLPDGLTQISDWLFFDCTHLESVTIPKSVTKIGTAAFCDIHTRAFDIVYRGSSDDWKKIDVDVWNDSLPSAKITFVGEG